MKAGIIYFTAHYIYLDGKMPFLFDFARLVTFESSSAGYFVNSGDQEQ